MSWAKWERDPQVNLSLIQRLAVMQEINYRDDVNRQNTAANTFQGRKMQGHTFWIYTVYFCKWGKDSSGSLKRMKLMC